MKYLPVYFLCCICFSVGIASAKIPDFNEQPEETIFLSCDDLQSFELEDRYLHVCTEFK